MADQRYEEYSVLEVSSAFQMMMDKGVVRGYSRVLSCVARNLFGPPDAATERNLMSIQDLERLDRLVDAVNTVGSWQELLATP